ncbi:MAG: hypothetical protein IK093_18895 [Ruminiclostridium sp.]|nr:hypothetical protein [Ruminiclostridium sp.]
MKTRIRLSIRCENVYENTYYGDYAVEEYLKRGAEDIPDMLAFRTKYLYEENDIRLLYRVQHNCSGFTARDPEEDFLLCHDLDTPYKMSCVTLAGNGTTGKTVGLSNLITYFFPDI